MRNGDRILITGAEGSTFERFFHSEIKTTAETRLRQRGSSASAAIGIFRIAYNRRCRGVDILFCEERRSQAQQ